MGKLSRSKKIRNNSKAHRSEKERPMSSATVVCGQGRKFEFRDIVYEGFRGPQKGAEDDFLGVLQLARGCGGTVVLSHIQPAVEQLIDRYSTVGFESAGVWLWRESPADALASIGWAKISEEDGVDVLAQMFRGPEKDVAGIALGKHHDFDGANVYEVELIWAGVVSLVYSEVAHG